MSQEGKTDSSRLSTLSSFTSSAPYADDSLLSVARSNSLRVIPLGKSESDGIPGRVVKIGENWGPR